MQKEGKKNDEKDDKTRWELMPLDCLEDIARVYTEGAKKYGENTWQYLDNGYERYKGALLRHLYAAEHDEFDEETGCRHLAQVAWNAIALLWLSKATDKYVFSKELSNAIAKEIGTTQSVNDFSTENISTKEGENKNITDSFEKTSVIENTSLFAKYGSLSIRRDNKDENLFYLVDSSHHPLFKDGSDNGCDDYGIGIIGRQQAGLLKSFWKEFEEREKDGIWKKN